MPVFWMLFNVFSVCLPNETNFEKTPKFYQLFNLLFENFKVILTSYFLYFLPFRKLFVPIRHTTLLQIFE